MNGVIVIDKPQGFTSFDVVAKLRGVLRERKIGHGGTLDPMATGVLPVFVGEATKLCDLDPANEKVYAAIVKLGLKTDTGDTTGNVTAEGGVRPSLEQLTEAAGRFLGEQNQIPPMYSAVKIGGKKLYELARAGKTVERKPRAITVYSLEITEFSEEGFSFLARCSKGTYIRTLAEDICESVGALGTLSALRRTRSGSFSSEIAVSLEDIQAAADSGNLDALLTPPELMFKSYPRLEMSGKDLERFLNGIKLSAPEGTAEGTRFSVFGEGAFRGLLAEESGQLRKILHYQPKAD